MGLHDKPIPGLELLVSLAAGKVDTVPVPPVVAVAVVAVVAVEPTLEELQCQVAQGLLVVVVVDHMASRALVEGLQVVQDQVVQVPQPMERKMV